MTEQPYTPYTGAAGTSVPSPEPLNAPAASDLDARIDAMVQARLDAAESKHSSQVAQMQAQIDALNSANRGPGGQLPDNAGGVKQDVSQTWGQFHQDLIKTGHADHPALAIAAGLE